MGVAGQALLPLEKPVFGKTLQDPSARGSWLGRDPASLLPRRDSCPSLGLAECRSRTQASHDFSRSVSLVAARDAMGVPRQVQTARLVASGGRPGARQQGEGGHPGRRRSCGRGEASGDPGLRPLGPKATVPSWQMHFAWENQCLGMGGEWGAPLLEDLLGP